ncbi:MAG TPA: hypothetical protein VF040_10850 [Ktedonobacterales bacterium]
MRWADAAAIVRRWWWVFVVVTLAISTLSLIGWVRTPPVYVAARTVYVAVVPAGMPSGQASYFAEQQALAVARTIVSPGFLTAPAYEQAVSRALASTPDHSLRDASPQTLGQALSASHSVTTITMAASWGSAAGASALATAAADALAQSNPAVLALLSEGNSSGEAPRFMVDSHAPPVVRDATAIDSARGTLLLRLALSVLAGLLVMGMVGLLERRLAGGTNQRETEPQRYEESVRREASGDLGR